MAFVVARNDGRFEIRESATTPRGPRARTLATFRVLTGRVLDEAEARARSRFDRTAIRARARALGAPRAEYEASHHARELVAELRRGRPPAPAIVSALRRSLPRRETLPDSLESAVDWIGASAAERGQALRDLLRLASRIPHQPRDDTLTFPRLESATVDA